MSKKELVAGKSKLQAEIPVTREDTVFDKYYGDIPAIKIPKGGFAQLDNIWSYPHELVGRTGTYKYSDLATPTFKTGITASKAGTTITATVGGAFVPTDTYGKYFVWPDGTRNQITGWTSLTVISVAESGTIASTAGCTIQEACYGSWYHKKSGKIIAQYGNRLFFTDYTFSSWTQIFPKVRTANIIDDSKTIFQDFDDDYVIGINYNGVFKICVTDTDPYYFRMNTPIPTVLITNVKATDDRTFGRRYIYSMSTLKDGIYTGNRIGDPSDTHSKIPTLTIEQESGTTKYDANNIDYGEVFTEKKVGTGQETYGLVIGGYGPSGAATGVNVDIELWRTLSASGFSINMNSLGRQDIFTDFSAVDTLDDVCRVAQNALRVYCPSATVKIDVSSSGMARFLVSTGEIDGTTITAISGDPIAPPLNTGLTDISGYDITSGCGLLCDNASGGVIATATTDPNYYFTAPSFVGSLIPALGASPSPAGPERKWTHFTVYSTCDTGKAGTNPNTGLGNDPEIYVYNNDIPIMKAFTAYRVVGTNVVIATQGYFNQEDCGCTIKFLNGDAAIIDYLTSDAAGLVRQYTGTSQYGHTQASTAIASQSAIIGNTSTLSILTGWRAGHTVTTDGTSRHFNQNDVGKPLFWADGSITWIKSYTSDHVVDTIDSGNIGSIASTMAIGIDPNQTTGRHFTDIVSDDVLKARMNFEYYLATNRLHEPLPENLNLGCMVPGFLVVGIKNEHKFYFSEKSAEREYRCGYYYAPEQYDNRIKDAIQTLEEDPDYLTIRCANSTYLASTTTTIKGTYGFLLSPASILDGQIGCNHTRSIKNIGVGQKIMVCSDYTVRTYTTNGYSESMSKFQIENVLKKASLYNFAHYDDIAGYLLWIATEV